MGEATVRRLGTLLLAAAVLATAGQAEAAEIRVLSAGAVRAVVTELAQAFEKETGHKVSLAFGTAGVTRQRLASEPADVVILTDVGIDATIKEGGIAAGTRTDIGRSGMGVGVRDGAARPDISTSDALKRALLATPSITYVDPAQAQPLVRNAVLLEDDDDAR